jgi:hypothetical protein
MKKEQLAKNNTLHKPINFTYDTRLSSHKVKKEQLAKNNILHMPINFTYDTLR